jgi:alpha/beta superfamily hydrolase
MPEPAAFESPTLAWHLAPGTWHLAPGTWHLASGADGDATEETDSMTAAHTPSTPPPDGIRAGAMRIDGPAGRLEIVVDLPPAGDAAQRGQTATGADGRRDPPGIAVVAHPHPLMGGTARHKVPHVLARTLAAAGWLVARPNFRGVGASAGEHDAGVGEVADILAVIDWLEARAPADPLLLAGFSFGAFVQVSVAERLAALDRPAIGLILVGLPFGDVPDGRHYATAAAPDHALVVHGEADDRAPLSAVLEWARAKPVPVTVIPAADHFLTGRLPLLELLVRRYLRGLDDRGRR